MKRSENCEIPENCETYDRSWLGNADDWQHTHDYLFVKTSGFETKWSFPEYRSETDVKTKFMQSIFVLRDTE